MQSATHQIDFTFSDAGNNVMQMMGNAQSSSVASGGSNMTGSVNIIQAAQQVQHMPASHASATNKESRPSIVQR